MHHDGMHFFPLPLGTGGSSHGLLVMNHEYLDEGLLFPDGQKTWSAEKVAKAQHAVGVSVIEVEAQDGAWRVVAPSRFARRITARTPCRVSGPAAGHALMRTAADGDGRLVLGTYNGCAHGWTPWGTYLTCEENWHFHFVHSGVISADQLRYRITATGRNYRWEQFDERFDAGKHPNEFNRFGWVVEIDPHDHESTPVKRTAMGRMAHEGAACSIGPDRRLAFYMGDDWEFEYIFKFVTARPFDPAQREANRDLLDSGTLYVARFQADGTGEWLPLVHGQGPLTAANGFADQGEVVIKARQAGDALGATKMDRTEWIVPHPATREVYAACTGNTSRGREGREGANPANRRAPNPFGHIVHWREDGDDPASTRFRWNVLVDAGPADKGGTIKGDLFGCPDGLWIDSRGTLWVETDVSPINLGKGDFAPLGNNQMLAFDAASGSFKRFLTGPSGCEIRVFVAVAENLHFGKAAQSLHIAQSAVSRTIRWMEQDLKVPLLVRNTRNVALTPEGTLLLQECRQIVAQFDKSIKRTRSISAGLAGELDVGCNDFAFLAELPVILKLFSRRFPDITIRLHEGQRSEQLSAMSRGKLDVSFVIGPVNIPDVATVTTGRYPLTALVSNTHPLAQRRKLRLRDLRKRTVYSRQPRRLGNLSRPSRLDISNGRIRSQYYPRDLWKRRNFWTGRSRTWRLHLS